MADADGLGNLADLDGKLASALGRELLGVVDAPHLGVVWQRHGADRDGPRNGASPDLVKAQDDAIAAHLAHERVHPLDSLSLGPLPRDTPRGNAAGAPDLGARIVGITLEQRLEL